MKYLSIILLLLSCELKEIKNEFPFVYAPDSVKGDTTYIMEFDKSKTYYKWTMMITDTTNIEMYNNVIIYADSSGEVYFDENGKPAIRW